MNNNNFEKRIKEKLNQFEIEPSENLLEHIFEKRALKTKGLLRFSYGRLGVALLTVTVLTIAIIYWPESGNKPDYKSIVVSGNQVSEDKNVKSGLSLTEQTKGSDKQGKQAETKGKSSRINSNKLSEDAGTLAENKKHNSKGSRNKQNRQRKNISKSETYAGFDGFRKEDYHDNGYNIEERYFNVDAKNKPLIASVDHQGNSHLMVYHSVNHEKMDNLNLNFLFLKPMKRIPSGKNELSQNDQIGYASFSQSVNRRKPFFIDVMVTPMLSFHQVSGNNDLEINYESLSKSNFNIQFNGRVSYPVSRNISLFTGIGYMNLTTDFEGGFMSIVDKIRYETVNEYINDPVQGTIIVSHIDTIAYQTNESSDYEFNNQYQILTFPLGLSYNFGYKNFDFALHGSALFNLYTGAEGSNADFTAKQTTEFKSSKKHAGIGGGFSVMAAYHLNNRYQLIIEPNMQYFMIDSQKNGNVVNEKILNTGLSLGLRYTLF